MTDFQLISSDSHVTMPDAAWQEYLDPRFRDRAPVIEETPEGVFRTFEGKRSPVGSLNNLAGKRPEQFSLKVRRLNEQRSGASDPVERIKDMDLDGVDAEVLYFGGPLDSSDFELRLNSVRGYNRWLSDYASFAPRRLLGMATLPIDTPDLAVAELRYVKDLPGIVGATIPLFPTEGDYGDPRWDVMWQAFLEVQMPIGLHIGGRRPPTPTPRPDAGPSRFMTHMVMSKLTMAECLSELIQGLVMQKYPALRFISVEAQTGWISFFDYYADHLWEKHRYWTDSKLLEPPSFYRKAQVYATFMDDPVGLREAEHIGVGNLMWASDYPHSETTWPDSRKVTDELFANYSDEDKQDILWRNCAQVFGLI